MTIKVCHDKFNKRANNFLLQSGKALWIITQVGLPLLVVFGVYQYNLSQQTDSYIDEFTGVMSMALGIIFTLATIIFGRLLDNSIYITINKKLKLFEWNEDC